jgi:dTDP-4-dehydrorhamnose 3,5-epimerase
VLTIEPARFDDERGFVSEPFRADRFAAAGLPVDFVQDTHARSERGVLRGLHWQRAPGQTKLVRVVRGAIWDVVVDLRRGSPTFGRHAAFELSAATSRMLLVPVGCAHGYVVLGDGADVVYKVSAPYDAAEERGVAWDDPDLAIPWPVEAPVLSARDRGLPSLRALSPEDLPR